MDDALQDAYVRAYRSLARFQGGSDLSTWLYRITYNACIDELRRGRRRPSPVDTAAPVWDRPSGQPGPERAATAADQVARALGRHPGRDPGASRPRRTVPLPGIDAPEYALWEWLEAVEAGDRVRAWELLGPQSQEYLGMQRFAEMLPSLAEGSFGKWTTTPEATANGWILPPPADGSAAVVVMAGTLNLEGTDESRVQAFPVRRGPDGWRVEAFAFGPGDTAAEFIVPAEGENGLGGIGPEEIIQVDAEPPGDVFIALDDGEPELMTPAQNVPGGRWRYDPPGRLSNGTHRITVITLAPEWFTATSTTFTVEG